MLISSWLSSLQSKLQRRSRTTTRRNRKLASTQHVASESLEVRALLTVTYNANEMFKGNELAASQELNPTFGPFSVGYNATLGGFTPYTTAEHNNNKFSNPNIQGFVFPGTVPMAMVNVSTTSQTTSYGATLDPSQIMLHPSTGGVNGILRFTAPTSGSYTIAGDWESVHSGITNNLVLHNGSTLVASTADNSVFNLTLTLNVGDRIDFVVNDLNGIGADSTGLRAVVTAPDPVGGNLLIAGGFELPLTGGPGTAAELPAYGPWSSSVGGCPGNTAILGMPYAGMPVREGVKAMHLGNCYGPGAVTQSFPTVIGTQYTVSLSVIGWSGGGGQVRATLTDPITTNLIANFNAPGGNVWGTNSFTFTATSTLTTIKVQNISGASTIDDVKVVAPSNSPPATPVDSNAAANFVLEGAANGTTVGVTALATDPNGDAVSYILTNTAGGRFAINSSSGVVSVANGTLLDGPGSHTITVQASDGKGGTSSSNFSISVGNLAPSLALTGVPTVNEGSPYTLNLGLVTDPGQDTITSYTITWGDGATQTITGNPANTTATHTYADGPNNQTHNVTVTDEDGTVIAGSLSVLVLNVDPTIALTGNDNVNEGSLYTLNLGTIIDPGADSVTAYSINWGDGNTENFSGNPSNTARTHTYADSMASRTISVALTDEDGTFTAGAKAVTIDNVAPTIVLTGNSNVNEGSPYTLNLGTIIDPGTDTVTDYSINWGDGSIQNFTGNPANTTKTHTYADGTNSYTISVSLIDEDAPHSHTLPMPEGDDDDHFIGGTKAVMVDNVAPTTPADDNAAPNEVTENATGGTLVGITAKSTDVGVLDTVTYSLTNNAGGRFAIHSSTGVVSVATGAVLDYEAATSHTITVQASDGAAATTQTFTINLLNQTATISGTVFVDADGDGLFDGGSETAIDAVIVELYNSAGGLLDTDLTELGGAYAFVVNDEFATYKIRETQPTGVNEGAAILGSAAGTVVSANEMQLTLQGSNATDYDFTESGQGVQAGDTATIGFWQNKNGQALIKQGGPALVNWLNANFGNVFGNTFTDGIGGDTDAEVASFYKNQFFSQKLKGTPKVDAQFMATAFATFFTSSNLSGGSVAASYGFNVTQTGIGTKVVNIGSNGAAFGVANNTNMTIMAILLATNGLTGSGSGYRNIYDTNGDGVLDDNEKALRVLANNIYSAINEGGDI